MQITEQQYHSLFLGAGDLPQDLRMTQDSRARGASPDDEWYRQCQGEHSGWLVWEAPMHAAIQRLVDIRWVFPSEDQAAAYHRQTMQTNCENLPYIQNAPSIGSECYAFGGRVEYGGLASLTSYLYLFRVGRVVVKLYAAQGEGQPLYVNSVAAVAQNVFKRVNSTLSPPQHQTPMQPTMPMPPFQQQGGYQQPQQNYQYPPQQQSPGYNYPGPSPQPLAQMGQQQWPGQYPSGGPKPSSALATAFAVLGSINWLVSIPFYILFMMAASGERLNRGDEEALGATAILTVLLSIPTAILFAVWLHQTWSAVPQQFRGTTPGKAVGYLFIPWFNLYWMFRAIPGLSKALQRAHQAYRTGYNGSAGFAVGLIACVLLFVPFLNLTSFIFFIVWIFMANSAKNRLLSGR